MADSDLARPRNGGQLVVRLGVCPSYDDRLEQLGLDVTQLVADEGGTVGAPLGEGSSKLLASLPRLLVASGDDSAPLGSAAALHLGASLGEGGMGVVRSAYDTAIGRDVAVKILTRAQPQSAAMELLREARIAGGLEHPNIVPVYALGRDDQDRLLMVMKRIRGTPWSELLGGSEDIDWPTVADDPLTFHLDVLIQLCNAVHFAHSKGIIHRDLKPANVMIGSFGEVYLLDWGVSVTLREDDNLLPRACDVSHIAGTPPYMAPELAAADGASIDERTDVYLLGAILHEILTGEPPHRGETLHEVLRAAFECAPPEIESAPWELVQICRQALAREPAHRYPDALALRQALGGYLIHRGSAELERQASATLDELEALLEAPEAAGAAEQIRRLATEARYGFRLALDSWPDNPVARRQLHGLLARMARYHIDGERRDEAAALLDELPSDVAAELQPEIDELDRRLGAKRVEMERLRQLAHDTDVTVQASERVQVALALTLAVALIGLSLVFRSVELALSYHELVVGLVVLGLVLAIGWRKLGRSNELNRRFLGSIAATMVALGVHLSAAMFAGLAIEHGLRQMMLIIAACLLVSSASLHRGFVLAAAVYGGCFLAMTLWPAGALAVFVCGHVAGFAAMAWVWRHAAARAERERQLLEKPASDRGPAAG